MLAHGDEAAEGGVDGIGCAVAAGDGGGAQVHIGAALGENVGAGAGALAVATTGRHWRSGHQAGELGGGFTHIAHDVARPIKLRQLLACQAGSLE